MSSKPLWDQIEGSWREFTGEVRREWGKLTDDDMEEIKGSRDVLVGKLQRAYGMATEEANRQIDDWARRLKF